MMFLSKESQMGFILYDKLNFFVSSTLYVKLVEFGFLFWKVLCCTAFVSGITRDLNRVFLEERILIQLNILPKNVIF